jgi:hypothetical protein
MEIVNDPSMRRATPALALCTLLVVALPAQAADQPAHRDSYGTKAPYSPTLEFARAGGPPSQQNPRTPRRSSRWPP